MNKTTRAKSGIAKPERSVINRKIARNILKKQNGNNKISKAWERYQQSKYGEELALKFKLHSTY